MRLFKSFSNNEKTAVESVNPQTAAVLMSYGSNTKNHTRHERTNQQKIK